jgi:hypothetical protein
MQKLWQLKPKLNYKKDVIDIVQFGSSIYDEKKANDLDIAVIFQNIELKEQLEQAQQIKKQIQLLSELPVHINSFSYYSLLDSSNFAKENILINGKSIITGESFVKIFGLTPKIQIYYSLEKLKKKDKVRFNYMLNGRNGEYGLLRERKGKLLKPGLIEIDPENELFFKENINEFKIDYNVRRVFIQ